VDVFWYNLLGKLSAVWISHLTGHLLVAE